MLRCYHHTLGSDAVRTKHSHLQPRYIFGGDRWQMTSGNPADCEGTYHNDVWKFNIDEQRWCCLIPDAQGA